MVVTVVVASKIAVCDGWEEPLKLSVCCCFLEREGCCCVACKGGDQAGVGLELLAVADGEDGERGTLALWREAGWWV